MLYVGGSNRTGSTLLDRTLGQLDGFVSVGELVNIWARSLTGDRLCGCTLQFAECEFWQQVGDRAFGGWEAVAPAMVRTVASRVARLRHLPLLVWPWLWPPYKRRMEAYGAILRRLYGAIRDVAGEEVVVDSSKSPSYALLLHRVGGFDVRILHIVRDSRAVAYSLVRRRKRRDVPSGDRYMPTAPPIFAAIAWSLTNLLFEMLRWTGVPIYRVHYEHFADDAQAVLEPALAKLIGNRGYKFDFTGPGWIRLGVGHSVDGNPMRTSVGTLPLGPNQDWVTALTPFHQRVITLFSYPLLWYYGYVGSTKSESAGLRTDFQS